MSRLLALTALLTVALAAGAVRPAAAATPCWKKLLTDWYDGRIDNTYQLHCYTDALKHLPPDVQTYSSAHDDILRALQSAREKLRAAGKKVTPVTLLPAPSTPSRGSGSGSTTTGRTSTTSTTPSRPVGGGASSGGGQGGGGPNGGGTTGRKSPGGLQKLADKLNPSSPTSLPVPLLVLGGLAILLVAAGAAGLLVKRLQGRRGTP